MTVEEQKRVMNEVGDRALAAISLFITDVHRIHEKGPDGSDRDANLCRGLATYVLGRIAQRAHEIEAEATKNQ